MLLNRKSNENEEQFVWRICQMKDCGSIELSWKEIADVVNAEFHVEEPLDKGTIRKAYQNTKKFYDSGVFNDCSLEDIIHQKNELEKVKVKVRDERNELRRLLREQARKESYKDQIINSILNCDFNPLEYDENKKFDGVLKSDNDIVCTFFDVHAGINIDGFFNKFNEDVLKDRINKYLDKIFEIYARHSPENVHVILSELVSGLIHNTLRIENNQDLIEQFIMISEYVSQFLAELSYKFNNVYVYVCPGNHSRITPGKDDSLRNENMDILVMPYLRAKLQNFDNITLYDNHVDKMIAMFDVRNQKVFAVHGDRTNIKNVVEKLTMYIGMKPDIVYCGHMHTNAMITSYDTKVIQAGCFSGSGDEYCMNKMLRNKPEQVVSVITDNGLECNYDVKLD